MDVLIIIHNLKRIKGFNTWDSVRRSSARCRDDPIARHGSRGGTAGVLDRKDSMLAQALARRDLR